MELRDKIMRFLNRHSYCVLSSASKGKPHSALVGYGNRGFDICCIAGAESRKVKNIFENPSVSIAIQGRSIPPIPPTSLLISGNAELLPREDTEALSILYSRGFIAKRMTDAILRKLDKMGKKPLFIKITPYKFVLNEFRDGFIRPTTFQPGKRSRN